MKELLVKRLYTYEKSEPSDIYLEECISFLDRVRYVNAYIAGFSKEKMKWLIYFLNTFDYPGYMYLIKKDDTVIGCLTLEDASKRSLFLYDFCIIPKYRNKGCGQKALNVVFNVALEMEKRRVCLYLVPTNVIARKLYTNAGFQTQEILIEDEN